MASASLTLQVDPGFPGGSMVKTCLQCRRHRRLEFDHWVRKRPWRTKWPHSSILAWKIPWTEEPGRLQSMGLQNSQTRLSQQTAMSDPNPPGAKQVHVFLFLSWES